MPPWRGLLIECFAAMSILQLLVFIALILTSGFSRAQDRKDSFEFLYQSNSALTNLDPDDLALVYNGRNYSGDIFNLYNKNYITELIRKDSENKDIAKDRLVIPFGPNFDFSELNSDVKISRFHSLNILRNYKRELLKESQDNYETAMLEMSEAELKTFLSKKHEFLKDLGERVENIFLKLKIKPRYKLINSFLRTLNNTMYLKAPLFLHSNTFGVPIYVTVGTGAAFGRLLYDLVIARTPLKKFIKPHFGFYFLTAFGVAFSTTKIGNRTVRSIDLFWDFERFKQSLTPVFEVFGAVGSGVFFETRNIQQAADGTAKVASSNSYKEAHNIPVAGMLKIGDRDFAINHGVGPTFPIYSLFLQNHFQRKYLHFTISDSAADKSKSINKNLASSVVDLFASSVSKKKLCSSYY